MHEDYKYLLFCSMSSNRESSRFEKLSPEKKVIHANRSEELTSSDWQPLKTSEELSIEREHGYFGVAYYRNEPSSQTTEVVFAHRGTCFDEKGNILADIAIAEKEEPEILQCAFQYVTKMFNGIDFYANAPQNLTEEQRNITTRVNKITHTGFSLGGFIAGACSALSNSLVYTVAITFDAPGIGHLLAKKTVSENVVWDKIINYVIEPNMVNTSCRHVGEVRELVFYTSLNNSASEEVEFNVTFSDMSNMLGSPFFIDLLTTFNRHNLDSIVHSSNNGNRFSYKTVYKWPVAHNIMCYGARSAPLDLSGITVFRGDDLGTTIVNVGSVIIQSTALFISTLVPHMVWEITKRNNADSITGIVGFSHKRHNRIFYSEDEYLLYIVKSTFHAVINSRELMRSIFETASTLVTNMQVSPGSSAAPAHLSPGRSDSRIEQEKFGPTATGRELTFVGPGMVINRRADVEMPPAEEEPARVVTSSSHRQHRRHKHRPS